MKKAPIIFIMGVGLIAWLSFLIDFSFLEGPDIPVSEEFYNVSLILGILVLPILMSIYGFFVINKSPVQGGLLLLIGGIALFLSSLIDFARTFNPLFLVSGLIIVVIGAKVLIKNKDKVEHHRG